MLGRPVSFQDTRLVGMLQGRVCDTLAQCGFPGRYAFGMERIAFDRPEKSFIPGAGCDVAAQYKGDNETYIEGPIGNDGIILYNSQMRDRLQTRRTKRNV